MARWLDPYLDSAVRLVESTQYVPTPRTKLIRWCQHYQSGAYLLCPYLTVHIGIGSVTQHQPGYTDSIATGGLSTFTAMNDNK